jgi:hypothetical protein
MNKKTTRYQFRSPLTGEPCSYEQWVDDEVSRTMEKDDEPTKIFPPTQEPGWRLWVRRNMGW